MRKFIRGHRGVGREPLVDADVVEARVLARQIAVLRRGDHLVHRVRHRRVVEPPPGHQGVRVVVELGVVRRGVSLPGVGLEVLDLPALVVAVERIRLVSDAGIELAVRQHPPRAGQGVQPIAHRDGLGGGEQLARLALGDVLRGPVASDVWNGRRGVVAQHADGHLAVEVHVLDELDELEVLLHVGQADQRRVPREVRAAELVGPTAAQVRDDSFRDGAQRLPGRRQAGADGVELVVEDEEVFGRSVLRVRCGLEHLLLVDLEVFRPVRLVHGEERGSHAARAGEELPPADTELLRHRGRVVQDARFDLLLLGRLRVRQIFAVRDHLRGDRRLQLIRHVRSDEAFELIFAEPRVFLSRARQLLGHPSTSPYPGPRRGFAAWHDVRFRRRVRSPSGSRLRCGPFVDQGAASRRARARSPRPRSSCRNAVAFADLFPWISRPRMTFVALGRWSLAFSYHFCDPAQLALARSPALAQHRGG